MNRHPALSTLLLLTLLAASDCRDSQDPSFKRAQRVWQAQEDVIDRAARGEKIDLVQFEKACLFFEDVAGISVPGEHSPVIDWYATEETKNALPVIRQWYRKNGDRLYWDYATQSVKVLRDV